VASGEWQAASGERREASGTRCDGKDLLLLIREIPYIPQTATPEFNRHQRKDPSMKTKIIRQSVTLSAAPADVYDALMDSRKHSRFTGGKASISRKEGGKFSVYDGYATGINLALKENKQIVQSWRASDWPEGHESKATFTLAKVKGGTRITFTHSGVPESQYASIKEGWVEFYWEPLKKLFEK
jgi:activator of HSP90 ATPase